ncbi:hypothetical protein EDB82DRAFT_482319 [Fusarium venenatum]|uniref:uncharacterized protein n=1 Tax=Fusarium venenatum TaxID=56646 RepID=UPI001D5A2AAB|nr:hypothetical protein EDB82DRAFT_482319 [Fusarium venenatum]
MEHVAVYELHGGNGDGADITFLFNGKVMSVSIFPTNGPSTKSTLHLGPGRPLQDHLVDVISEAITCKNHNEYEKLVDEVFGVILEAGRPLFSSLGSITQQSQSLHELLFPEIIYFRLQAPAMYATILPIDPSKANNIIASDPAFTDNWDEELKIRRDLPCFTPDEMTVTKVLLRGFNSVTAAVRVHGRDLFCKVVARPSGLCGTEEGRELEYLGEISKAFQYPDTIHVPQFLGYVHHKETQQILGFLQEWVHGSRLSNINITTRNRGKWMAQISQTINRLHEHGLFWGNGKPGNVLIDEKDDIWLIGCGGGFMYEDNQGRLEIIERDQKACTEIAEFLNGGNGTTLSG